ncbi:hypothetical protein ACQ4PT_065835 [Festuca glaucescens]
MGLGEEALHAGRPPRLPHHRSTPELELHAPPSSPEAAARTGPQKPRSGPAAMRDHGHWKLSTHSLDPVPSAPPSRAAAPSRTAAAAQADGPHDEAPRERGPAPGVGGASFARPHYIKRLADRKSAKFQKNITKRGSVPETTVKKGSDYPVGPIVLGFFVFVVIGSCELPT